jgi:hypothetical protein
VCFGSVRGGNLCCLCPVQKLRVAKLVAAVSGCLQVLNVLDSGRQQKIHCC